ncbi:DUF559 domain-containing protein [Aliihoeflea aestuarii]|uniref:endonuclease domain-containing protein n=1 Tax=Aliihoeflea aestuarii TaxID=453840 RepID=UPI002094D617|nr:endonuclease domain-containing protein [Aliihoeflea aestuarii]MCO6392188.1 DUF559 domain-containing protein [Aliihoeflea aestuarii]
MTNSVAPITRRREGATGRARLLRDDETDAEMRLWRELRNRRLNGFKFARQVPLGPYFADFVCCEVKLVGEVDGSQHAESVHDERRTLFLNGAGYSVLRFWNGEVLQEREAVLDTILAALEGRLNPSPGRFAATLSPAGRGERSSLTFPDFTNAARQAAPLPAGERVAAKRPGEGGEA